MSHLLDLAVFPYGGYVSLAMREDLSAVPSEEIARRVDCTIARAKVRVKGLAVRFHGIVLMNLQDATKKGEWREYREGYGSTSYGRRGFGIGPPGQHLRLSGDGWPSSRLLRPGFPHGAG